MKISKPDRPCQAWALDHKDGLDLIFMRQGYLISLNSLGHLCTSRTRFLGVEWTKLSKSLGAFVALDASDCGGLRVATLNNALLFLAGYRFNLAAWRGAVGKQRSKHAQFFLSGRQGMRPLQLATIA